MNGHSWGYRATLIALLFFSSFASIAQPPQAVNGQVDARTWDFTNSQLALDGTWTWLDFELLSPRDMADTVGQNVDFPKVWNEIRPFRGGEGFATYALTILLPEGE
ncbi:MAG: hypothetical protein K2U26_03610, partial [Cyclobacteriaceae bacterium]|nr:hypothetical protein [Cyclobacteriaceae bacterium]